MNEAVIDGHALGGHAPGPQSIRFAGLFARTAVAHTVTYFFMGVLAATALHY